MEAHHIRHVNVILYVRVKIGRYLDLQQLKAMLAYLEH